MPRNRKKFQARTIQEWSGGEKFLDLPELKMDKWVEARVNGGMITMLDPADIPPGALQQITNGVVRFDKTSRRAGTTLFGPTKPDAEAVLKLASLKTPEGFAHTVRFTKTSLYDLQAGAWVAIAGVLTGTEEDRIQTAVLFDQLVFANNGADELQVVDFGANTFGDLGNAPKYRYVTGFYNRVIGAALRDSNEVQIGWSAEYPDVDEWNPLTLETAGNSPLIESTSDLSDFITGVFGLKNVMVVMREKSLWLATRKPVPTDPFHFYPAVPGIGCDSPFSARVITSGLAWMDRRTRTVYAWNIGSEPEPIGMPIEKTLVDNIDDPSLIFGSYDPINYEYSVCIPRVGSNLVPTWTYNFRTKSWAYNELYAVTSFDDTELGVAGVTIDGLGAVPIDTLSGTIDELSPASDIVSTRIIGRNDGSLVVHDNTVDVDAEHDDQAGAIDYETILTSKQFTTPENDVYIAKIVVEYIMQVGGQFTLEYSLDGGDTDENWRTARVVSPVHLNRKQILTFRKVIKTRKFAWRLRGTRGRWDLVSYELWVYPAGQSSERQQFR